MTDLARPDVALEALVDVVHTLLEVDLEAGTITVEVTVALARR